MFLRRVQLLKSYPKEIKLTYTEVKLAYFSDTVNAATDRNVQVVKTKALSLKCT